MATPGSETKAAEAGLPPTTPCPWCGEKWEKDEKCNWVCCGLLSDNKTFLSRFGCGMQYCWECGKKLCGRLYGADGKKIAGVSTNHSATCGCLDDGTFCPGGHNSHCPPRWGTK